MLTHSKLFCICPSLFQRCQFYLILKHIYIFLLMAAFSLLAVIPCGVSRLILLGLIPHCSDPGMGPTFLVPGLEGDSWRSRGEPEEVNPVLEQEQRGLGRARQPSLWGRERGCQEVFFSHRVYPDSLPSFLSLLNLLFLFFSVFKELPKSGKSPKASKRKHSR